MKIFTKDSFWIPMGGSIALLVMLSTIGQRLILITIMLLFNWMGAMQPWHVNLVTYR
jgi:hypothetical protein